MKYFKNSLVTFTLLFLLIVAIFAFVSQILKPEWMKEYLNHRLSEVTSLPVAIEGAVAWKLFPQPGIKISNIVMGNEDTQPDVFLKINQVILSLKITPLLGGKLVFNEMYVDGFSLQKNFDSKMIKISQKKDHNEEQGNLSLEIERLLLSHGHVLLIQKERRVEFTDLQLEASQLNLENRHFPFQLKSLIAIEKNNETLLKTHIQFKGSTALSSHLFAEKKKGMNDLFLNGQSILKNTKINRLKIDKINAHTLLKNNILKLSPLTFDLYQGNSVGDLQYNLQSKMLKINQTASDLNCSQLSKDLLEINLLKGAVDLALHVESDLNTSSWHDALSGTGNFSMKDGSIETVNLQKIALSTKSQIQQLLNAGKQDKSPGFNENSFNSEDFFKGNTPFKVLTVQYRLNHENLTADSLFLQTEDMKLNGQGQFNLNNFSLDSRFQLTLPGQMEPGNLQTKLGGSYPFVVRGSILKPIIYPDFSMINPLLAGWLLKEKLSAIVH